MANDFLEAYSKTGSYGKRNNCILVLTASVCGCSPNFQKHFQVPFFFYVGYFNYWIAEYVVSGTGQTAC